MIIFHTTLFNVAAANIGPAVTETKLYDTNNGSHYLYHL